MVSSSSTKQQSRRATPRRCCAVRWAGQMGEAVRRLRAVWAEAHRHVFPRLAVDAGFWLAGAHHILGELAEAERIAGEASELAARGGGRARRPPPQPKKG